MFVRYNVREAAHQENPSVETLSKPCLNVQPEESQGKVSQRSPDSPASYIPPQCPDPPRPPPPAVLGCAPVSHNPAPKTTDGHVDQDFVPLSPCLRCDVAAALHVENLLKVTRNMTPTGPIQLTVGILTGGDLRKRRCQGHT